MASEPAMNRRMRTRMSGGVGRAGEKPALTRLGTAEANVPLNFLVCAGHPRDVLVHRTLGS